MIMIKLCFQAREELDTTTSREVNPRWLKLWLARHPDRYIQYTIRPLQPPFNFSVGVITEEVLHSRYLAHVKRESRSYVNQVSKEEQVEQTSEEAEEQGDEVAGEEEQEMKQEGEQWTAELREQLWQEKVHVEEKLRCIQDEHFYELLQVSWLPNLYYKFGSQN